MDAHPVNQALSDVLNQARKFDANALAKEWDAAPSLVFMGAGNLGRMIAERLARIGIVPVAFCDNNAGLRGGQIHGVPILSPEEAVRRHADAAIFVITVFASAKDQARLSSQLHTLGAKNVAACLPLLWRYPEVCLPFYSYDLPERIAAHAGPLREVLALLADEPSRQAFLADLKYRVSNEVGPGDAGCVPVEQYFGPLFYRRIAQEAFVDCGAFDGDSLQSFIAHRGSAALAAYMGFEPDPANFDRLTRVMQDLGCNPDTCRAIPAGVGAKSEWGSFASSGTMTAGFSGAGGGSAKIVSLDEACAGWKPTFIKMDIEGGEREALRGARNTLQRFQPLLAISVYHKPNDLWEIPLAIHEIQPAYRYYLRSHGHGGLELVLYAVPPDRVMAS